MGTAVNWMRATALTMAVMVAPVALGSPSVGGAAPGFELNAMGGKQLGLNELRGQVVLINFWASWCGPCRTEMPRLDALYRKYKAAGVSLVGINVEPDSAEALNYLKSTPVTFPILFDTDSKVSKLYDVAGMPSTVILDRKGTVRYIHRGYKPGEEDAYLDQIRALMRE
jgi:peroxiredoxin